MSNSAQLKRAILAPGLQASLATPLMILHHSPTFSLPNSASFHFICMIDSQEHILTNACMLISMLDYIFWGISSNV
jgi:hypothetical protein